MIDLTNRVFGRLIIKEQAENKSGRIRWLCQCACGNHKIIRADHLLSGRTQSCGCLQQELVEGAGHAGTHYWLKKHKPKPELCERCRERLAKELSYNNTSKKRYSRNPDDYEWLCQSCHRLKDFGSGAIMTKARMHRIREFYKCKAVSRIELANLFRVSEGVIDRIINYEGIYQRPVNPEVFKELIEDLEA